MGGGVAGCMASPKTVSEADGGPPCLQIQKLLVHTDAIYFNLHDILEKLYKIIVVKYS